MTHPNPTDPGQTRAILDRLNQRLDVSLSKTPPSKRWVRRALHRQGAGRCPVRLKWTDEWGTVWHHSADGVGATPLPCPLTDWNQLDDYLAYHIPDPQATGRREDALARQTPAQVKDEVRATIDLMGKSFHNDYLVAPSSALTPELPLANIGALFEACHNQKVVVSAFEQRHGC